MSSEMPQSAQLCFERGNALLTAGQYQEAIYCYQQAIALKADYPEAYWKWGNALLNLGDYPAALRSYELALAYKADYAEAYNNRGIALQNLQEVEMALESFNQAIALKPDYSNYHNNRGLALHKLQRYAEETACYQQALALKPNFAEAYNNYGNALQSLQRYEEALSCYERALALKPDYAKAYFNRGNALQGLKHYDAALQSYAQALVLKPDYAAVFNSQGIVLHNLKQAEAAVNCYQRAIALQPDYVDAYCNLGQLHTTLKQYREAILNFDQAFNLQPDHEFLRGHRLKARMQICDWQDFDAERAAIADSIAAGKNVATPFEVLMMLDNPALQRKAAESWIAQSYSGIAGLQPLSAYAAHDPIRIAYFSADFRTHPVAFLTAELFERHDRKRFEIFAFSFGPDTGDAMRLRLQAGFDRFLDVADSSDLEIARLARSLEIDIAIDLGGHTADSRPGIFALRAAPIQAAYLGYPGTLGASFMDYLLADRVVIPDGSRQHYAEKIVYLPGSFMPNDSQRLIAGQDFSRAEMNLPESGFVFCSFNNHYKITPAVFACWMRILKAVTGSVLWLSDSPDAAENLRREAVLQGVAGERLVFAPRLPDMAEHLGRQRLADLFLDTLPYNAHTTSSDALWAGLPVLTCPGESFPSRVAASLLTALDLPELIVESPLHYEQLAIELATDTGKYAAVKSKLAANRLTAPLFDTPAFTRHLEKAYLQIYHRLQNSLPPEDINV